MTHSKPLMLAAALALMAVAAAAPPAAIAQDTPAPTEAAKPGDPGATPMSDQAVFEAFHGKAGIQRIAEAAIDRSVADPRIAEVFKGIDIAKLKTHLAQQLCYVLGGGCAYTGRDMASSHKDLGVNMAEMNALVENLQWAMDKEGVPFRAQNKLLAKLAPMKKDVVTR
ncbi:MAG: group 1 hemoglobin [Caulobacter sp.]|nr:group 1 hemoglobin [Caulobacter sp.]